MIEMVTMEKGWIYVVEENVWYSLAMEESSEIYIIRAVAPSKEKDVVHLKLSFGEIKKTRDYYSV